MIPQTNDAILSSCGIYQIFILLCTQLQATGDITVQGVCILWLTVSCLLLSECKIQNKSPLENFLPHCAFTITPSESPTVSMELCQFTVG